MKTWWVPFLFACTTEPRPAPVAQPTASPVAQPIADDSHTDVLVTGEPAATDRTRPATDVGAQISDVREGGKDLRVGTAYGSSYASGAPMAADPQKRGRISVIEKQAFDNTTLTAELVLAKITAAYMMSISRCYRDYLKKDPSANGELVLKLTVDSVGRAVGATATGVASEIGDCTTAIMASWRFPVPRNANGDPVPAAFQIKLGLVPG
jgi:hypothetical protein